MSSRISTVAFVLLAFASGGASGFVVGRSQAARGAVEVQSRQEILDGLDREVGLTADQRAKFREISNANHPRVVAVNRSVKGDLAAIRSDVRGAMRALLDDEQKRRFDGWCNRRDASREE